MLAAALENLCASVDGLMSTIAAISQRLTVVVSTSATMSERITLLEQSVSNCRSNHANLFRQVDNIHGFCEDLVAGRWKLEALFPEYLQVKVDSPPPTLQAPPAKKRRLFDVDSSALLYATDFSHSRKCDSTYSFEPY